MHQHTPSYSVSLSFSLQLRATRTQYTLKKNEFYPWQYAIYVLSKSNRFFHSLEKISLHVHNYYWRQSSTGIIFLAPSR